MLLALGCDEAAVAPVSEPDRPPTPCGTKFDPATSGTVLGRVVWTGAIPAVAPYHIPPDPVPDRCPRITLDRDNPNAPRIDRQTDGVEEAVVFLRGIDPERGRPWDHAPAEVVMDDYRFQVLQGDRPLHCGFVRCGDKVRMVSRQPVFHAVHADGAAFFSLMFPDPGSPLTRPLKERGIVELTSASGYYWMRAYLFVDDHPYYAVTAGDGRFDLAQVPAGRYEIVCWLPNWLEEHHVRDPETARIMRILYRPAVEQKRTIDVKAGANVDVNFTVSANAFQH